MARQKKYRCACGARITRAHQAHHERGRLHQGGRQSGWDEEKHRKYVCACGRRIAVCQRFHHELGRWHRHADRARALREQGFSSAAIGREVGLSRAFVARVFHLMEAEEPDALPEAPFPPP